jgi:hypothetical protein
MGFGLFSIVVNEKVAVDRRAPDQQGGVLFGQVEASLPTTPYLGGSFSLASARDTDCAATGSPSYSGHGFNSSQSEFGPDMLPLASSDLGKRRALADDSVCPSQNMLC